MVAQLDNIDMQKCPRCGELKSAFEVSDQHGCYRRKPVAKGTMMVSELKVGAYERVSTDPVPPRLIEVLKITPKTVKVKIFYGSAQHATPKRMPRSVIERRLLNGNTEYEYIPFRQ